MVFLPTSLGILTTRGEKDDFTLLNLVYARSRWATKVIIHSLIFIIFMISVIIYYFAIWYILLSYSSISCNWLFCLDKHLWHASFHVGFKTKNFLTKCSSLTTSYQLIKDVNLFIDVFLFYRFLCIIFCFFSNQFYFQFKLFRLISIWPIFFREGSKSVTKISLECIIEANNTSFQCNISKLFRVVSSPINFLRFYRICTKNLIQILQESR